MLYTLDSNTNNITPQYCVNNTYATLPPGVYDLKINRDYHRPTVYIRQLSTFKLPTKIYGTLTSMQNRILRTYQDRPFSTGVLLNGNKGSGKTLLSQMISNTAVGTLKIPVILVNDYMHSAEFAVIAEYLQNLGQPAVLVFDEFEKKTEGRYQIELLAFLDGVIHQQKMLYLFITNSDAPINEYYKERPGRIFYHFRFRGLDEDAIRTYIRAALKNTSYTEPLVTLLKTFPEVNFDVLASIVEEMNRYDMSPKEAVDGMNAPWVDTPAAFG